VRFIDIAETIADGLGVPPRSIIPDEAAAHFTSPFMAMLYGADVPAASDLTREKFGWTPTQRGLLSDLSQGDYLHTRTATDVAATALKPSRRGGPRHPSPAAEL